MSEVADKRIKWPVEMFSDLPQWQARKKSSRMLCEVLLSSLWFLFVIFWVETISVWLFLSMFYQDRAFYHWGDGVFADDPGQMIYMLSRVDTHMQTEMQT